MAAPEFAPPPAIRPRCRPRSRRRRGAWLGTDEPLPVEALDQGLEGSSLDLVEAPAVAAAQEHLQLRLGRRRLVQDDAAPGEVVRERGIGRG